MEYDATERVHSPKQPFFAGVSLLKINYKEVSSHCLEADDPHTPSSYLR